jgi:predicted neutral ceramidase superfamily lipid hydrolase
MLISTIFALISTSFLIGLTLIRFANKQVRYTHQKSILILSVLCLGLTLLEIGRPQLFLACDLGAIGLWSAILILLLTQRKQARI